MHRSTPSTARPDNNLLATYHELDANTRVSALRMDTIRSPKARSLCMLELWSHVRVLGVYGYVYSACLAATHEVVGEGTRSQVVGAAEPFILPAAHAGTSLPNVLRPRMPGSAMC
jgi:hypothetical protein